MFCVLLCTFKITIPQIMDVKTPKQVRAKFARTGTSISSWAVTHGFNPSQVFNVLAGRNKGLRGKSHDIAVTLGIKNGQISS
jgi:gp16 family phage-associated protein